MRLMIASDIHGSAAHTERLLRRWEAERADRLLLLGDILYHGPRNDLPEGYDPRAVAAMLNPLAARILCVRGNCDAEVDQMVLDFPLAADHAEVLDGAHVLWLTHGHVYDENHMPPLRSGDALVYGHTHLPVLGQRDGVAVVNPGSVSIPKAGSARGYAIYEDGEFRRCDLDGRVESRRRFWAEVNHG